MAAHEVIELLDSSDEERPARSKPPTSMPIRASANIAGRMFAGSGHLLLIGDDNELHAPAAPRRDVRAGPSKPTSGAPHAASSSKRISPGKAPMSPSTSAQTDRVQLTPLNDPWSKGPESSSRSVSPVKAAEPGRGPGDVGRKKRPRNQQAESTWEEAVPMIMPGPKTNAKQKASAGQEVDDESTWEAPKPIKMPTLKPISISTSAVGVGGAGGKGRAGPAKGKRSYDTSPGPSSAADKGKVGTGSSRKKARLDTSRWRGDDEPRAKDTGFLPDSADSPAQPQAGETEEESDGEEEQGQEDEEAESEAGTPPSPKKPLNRPTWATAPPLDASAIRSIPSAAAASSSRSSAPNSKRTRKPSTGPPTGSAGAGDADTSKKRTKSNSPTKRPASVHTQIAGPSRQSALPSARRLSPEKAGSVDALDLIPRSDRAGQSSNEKRGRVTAERSKPTTKGKARMDMTVEIPPRPPAKPVSAPRVVSEEDLALLDSSDSGHDEEEDTRPAPPMRLEQASPSRIVVRKSALRVLSPDSDEDAPMGQQRERVEEPVRRSGSREKAPPLALPRRVFELSPSPDPILFSSRGSSLPLVEVDTGGKPRLSRRTTDVTESDEPIEAKGKAISEEPESEEEDEQETTRRPGRLAYRPNRLDKMTREQWRAMVERERQRSGEGSNNSASPIELDLTSPGKRKRKRESDVHDRRETTSVDGVEWTVTASFSIGSGAGLGRDSGTGSADRPFELAPSPEPSLDTELDHTPAQYRAPVRRHFETKTIDAYNRMLPQLTANPDLHRAMFQIWISESTARDEPHADEIRVYNEADEEAEAPDMEFEYSNQMLYDHDVPDPEIGTGCSCDGPCNPRSRACGCVRRQKLYYYGLDMDGFAYNPDGTVKETSVPIWECGPTCGCPPSCMNRVIQRGRSAGTKIDLFKTTNKGWGVRARVNLPAGTYLGVYSGEVVTDSEGERRGHLYNDVGRTYLFDLDGYQIREPPDLDKLAEVDPRLAQLARRTRGKVLRQREENEGVDAGYNAYCVDAFHFGFTRYLNHSCQPNLAIIQAYYRDYHPERPSLAIFTTENIRAGEELCISYVGIEDPDEDDTDVPVSAAAPLPISPVRAKGQGGKAKGKGTGKGKSKGKQEAVAASVHLAGADKDNSGEAICRCGAPRCNGFMFRIHQR